MLYKLSQLIKIDGHKLQIVGSIVVRKSIDQISDTAEITIANVRYEGVHKHLDKIKRGHKVEIEVGYNDSLHPIFSGYIQKVDLSEVLKLTCEDGIFLFRKFVPDKYVWNGASKRESDKVSLTQIIKYVIDKTGAPFTIDNRMGDPVWYDKYTITAQATGLQVLEDLKNDGFINIYVKGDKLVCDFKYNTKENKKTVALDFSKNVESSALEYLDANTLNKKVIYEGQPVIAGKKRIKIIGTAGQGNDIIRIKTMRNLSQSEADKEAERLYKHYAYDGLRGSINLWLQPVVEPLDALSLQDYEGSVIKGKYLINSVTTTVNEQGGKQEITINRKLN